ncbi:transposase [Paraburkholderia sp. WC7.3d]
MTNQTQLFEAALGINAPWYVQGVDFSTELTIAVDFVAGSRFAYPGVPGEHPVHDTVIKRLRHLNFFQFDCYLEVRVPRVRLPDGSVRLVEPDWMGRLDGFTLLFEGKRLAMAVVDGRKNRHQSDVHHFRSGGHHFVRANSEAWQP